MADLVPIRQPLPNLRHLSQSIPTFAVSRRACHFKALLCASPILVCPTRHDPQPRAIVHELSQRYSARPSASLGLPQAFSEFVQGGPYTPSEHAPLTRV